MKPAQIGLLIVLGAIGGAIAMKVAQRSAAPLPVPVAQSQPLEPAAPAIPAQPPAEVTAPAEPARPSPIATTKPAAPVRTLPVHQKRLPPIPSPVEVARNAPPAVSAPPAQPEPASAPVAVASPPPPPSEPARPEPEHVTPAPRPPEVHTATLNTGMLVPVRLVDGLSTERNVSGDTFTATLDKELVVDGFVIAERGARVEGRVVAADKGGKTQGVSSLAVELTRLHTSDGQTVAIHTDSFERHAAQTQTQDAAKIGGGAALGAIIGAIAGGGKGAAVGAGVGGAAGAGDVLLTRGKPTTLPSETRITFRLNAPVTLTEQR